VKSAKLILIYVLVIFVGSCTFTKQKTDHPPIRSQTTTTDTLATDTSSSVTPYKTLALKKYHSQVVYKLNPDKTYVLCVKKQNPKPFVPKQFTQLRFFVYDLKTNKLIFEDSLENGHVQWENSNQIKVTITPEIVKDIEVKEYGYRYNVITRKKIVR